MPGASFARYHDSRAHVLHESDRRATVTDNRGKPSIFPLWGQLAIPAGILWGTLIGVLAGIVFGNIVIGAAIGAGLGVGIGLALFAAAVVVASSKL